MKAGERNPTDESEVFIREDSERARTNSFVKQAILDHPIKEATSDMFFKQKQGFKKPQQEMEPDLQGLPRSQREFIELEQKKRKLAEMKKAKVIEDEIKFRLRQRPEHQSPIARQKEEEARRFEKEKLKQIRRQYDEQLGRMSPDLLKQVQKEELQAQRERERRQRMEEAIRPKSDLATYYPEDNRSHQDMIFRPRLGISPEGSKHPSPTNDKHLTKNASLAKENLFLAENNIFLPHRTQQPSQRKEATGSPMFEQGSPERINPNTFKTYLSNRESLEGEKQDVASKRLTKSPHQTNYMSMRNIEKNNSLANFEGNRNLGNSSSRYNDSVHQIQHPLQQTTRQMSDEDTAGRFDPKVRSQIEEIVRLQLQEQTSKDRKNSTVKLETRGKSTHQNMPSFYGGSALDKQSARSLRTATSATKGKNPVKVMSNGTPLTPLGDKGEPKKKKESKTQEMLKSALATEVLIDKLLQVIEDEPTPAEDWPQDAHENDDLVETLSHSKMINEVNHREPRGFTESGVIEPLPWFSTSSGNHSTSESWRKSDLEQLGPAVSLYLKMLKYFGCLFFFFAILSLPSIFIFASGEAYSLETQEVQKFVAGYSLGNLGIEKEIVAHASDIKDESLMIDVELECSEQGALISDFVHFGLAFQNYTVVGVGTEKTVRTIDRCTYGNYNDQQREYELDKQFAAACSGKSSCKIALNLTEVMEPFCQWEIQDRLNGKLIYGPPKVFTLALCKAGDLEVTEGWVLSRDSAARIIVWFDVAIQVIFLLAVFRLQYLEELTVQDLRKGTHRVEDFSVYVSDIGLANKDFSSNPELLTAMVVTHLEDVLKNELQVIEEMEDSQEHQDQIVSVNFGLTSQNIMKYLVRIYEDAKRIAELKKKIRNDPLRAAEYEREIWKLYTRITNHKDTYYHEKLRVEPNLKNMYITFRSMEARERALQAYSPSPFRRLFAEMCCCLGQMFLKKKLLRKWFYSMDAAVSPETIIWENLGVPLHAKVKKWAKAIIFVGFWFAVSLYGLWELASMEKKRLDYVKSDCSGGEADLFSALEDWNKPAENQLGLMNCFCEQQYLNYGSGALRLTFEDGVQHCQDWFPIHNFQSYQIYLLGGFLALLNFIFQYFFDWVCESLNMPKNTTRGNTVRTQAIFASQYINTCVVLLLAFHSILFSQERIAENKTSDFLIGPFDEFNQRWYFIIGVPLLLCLGLQILSPHFGVLLHSIFLLCRRCRDRSYSCDARKTRQVVQSDYEDMYTGPEFILQVRLAQVLSCIFITMTFSCGIPALYLVSVVSFFLTYWIDKILLLRYFRLTQGYTKFLTRNILRMLPLAVILHFFFGTFLLSVPGILSSRRSTSWFSAEPGAYEQEAQTSQNQYFNRGRLGQDHMVIFCGAGVVLLVVMLLQSELTRLLSLVGRALAFLFEAMLNRCSSRTALAEEKVKVQGFENSKYSDDLFREISYGQLFEQYVKYKKERLKYKLLKSKSAFSELDLRKYVDPYISTVERNEHAVFSRLSELCELYIERIEGIEPDLMSQDQRIKVVYQYFQQATDKDNPLRYSYELDQSMLGNMAGTLPSFDLMENPKYKRINKLLLVMNETFGFNQELNGLIRHSITEANHLLAKRSIELRRMFEAPRPRTSQTTQ